MRIYLDEDLAARRLLIALSRAGHDVQSTPNIGRSAASDARQLLYAARESRVIFTGNHDDFEDLHNLVVYTGGTHPGIVTIRQDGTARGKMSTQQIVQAVANLAAAMGSLQSSFSVLNHWR